MSRLSDADTELLKIAATNAENESHAAFEAFCVDSLPRLVDVIRSSAFRYGLPSDLADDIAHESIIKAVTWLRRHPDAKVSGRWLTTLAINQVRDWRRRERHKVPLDPEHIAHVPAVDSFQEKELFTNQLVLETFQRLPKTDQTLLKLVLFDGYDTLEAGALLGFAKWAAYKRYERALKRLRDMLEKPDRKTGHPL